MKIWASLPFFLLLGCSPLGKDFCLHNGYVEDSQGYEACTRRYSDRYDAFSYCTRTQGIQTEGRTLDQCLKKTAPKVKLAFTKDRQDCSQKAQAQVENENGTMDAVQGIIDAIASFKETPEQYQKRMEEQQKRDNEREEKVNSLTAMCMTMKGWQDGDVWYDNVLAPNISTDLDPSEEDEDLKDADIPEGETFGRNLPKRIPKGGPTGRGNL